MQRRIGYKVEECRPTASGIRYSLGHPESPAVIVVVPDTGPRIYTYSDPTLHERVPTNVCRRVSAAIRRYQRRQR